MALCREDRNIIDWMVRRLLSAASQRVPPYDVDAIAVHLGVRVVTDWDDDRDYRFRLKDIEGRLGLSGSVPVLGAFVFDDQGNREIRLAPGCSPRERRSVLAHELAHVAMKHDKTQFIDNLPVAAPVSLLEDQALYGGHQILSGVDQFAKSVEDVNGGDPWNLMGDILHLREIFGLRRYVALRSFVEHTNWPVALVSLIHDNNGIRVVEHVSEAWGGGAWPDDVKIRTQSSGFAVQVQMLIRDPHDDALQQMVLRRVAD